MLNGYKKTYIKPGGSHSDENINTLNGLKIKVFESVVLKDRCDYSFFNNTFGVYCGILLCHHDHPYSKLMMFSKTSSFRNKTPFINCSPGSPVVLEDERKEEECNGQLPVTLVDSESVKQVVPKTHSMVKTKESNHHKNKQSHPKQLTNSKKTSKVIQRNSSEERYSNVLDAYFTPVRRSSRKTSLTIKKEKQNEVEAAVLSGKEEGFEVRDILGKGRGVFTTRKFLRGDFVLEYYGELISMQEAKVREAKYAADENIGCYMYYFVHKNKQYCVDATKDTGRLGRLVNHSINGNLKTLPFPVKDVPRLILIAKRDIEAGEELLYDYGDRSKSSLECHPWLAT